MTPRLCLAVALALASACDDEPATTSDTSTTTPTDTSTDTGTPGDTSADPCDPNPCTLGQADDCNAGGTAVQTHAATGTCTPVDSAATCVYAVESTTPCTGDTTCQAGHCSSNEAACGYTFSQHVSYITTLRIGNVAEDGGDKCCFDYDGDSAVDNKVGELIKLVSAFPQVKSDVNEVVADNIASGKFTLLVEAAGLDQLPSDGDVDLRMFYGTDTDSDHGNNVAGTGTFTADLSSFAPGTADPVTHFDDAVITNGNLFAGPSTFRLVIPLTTGFVIEGNIQKTRLEGTVSAGASGGLNISGGGFGAKLGGVFHQDQLFGAINNYVAGSCACLDAGTETVLERGEDGSWSCNSNIDSSACDDTAGSDEAPCVTIVTLCDAALLLVTPDIDAEGGDGINESLSVGLWVQGVGASLVGVAPDICE